MTWSRETQRRGPAPRWAQRAGYSRADTRPGRVQARVQATAMARTVGSERVAWKVTAAFFLKKTQTSAVGRGLGPDLHPPSDPRPGQRPPPSPRPGHRHHRRLVRLSMRRHGRFASAVRSLFSIFSASALLSSLLGEVQRPRAERAPARRGPGEGGPGGSSGLKGKHRLQPFCP